MSSTILSRRDLEFLLYEWLDVTALCGAARYADHSRETFDAALETCEQIATELFATHNKKADANEPHFDGERVHIIPEVAIALKAFNSAGLMAAGQDYALGGMQLPAVVEKAGFAYFKAANVGTSSYPFLTIGNANLLLAHGSEDQIERFVKPMMTGRFYGTMCLSEPQAGSSLADITTRAEPQEDGSFRLSGSKMWISAGEHELSENIVHLVLARIPGSPPGVKGISLFVVPKFLVNFDGSLGERNDVTLAGLNHKMGYRGTTNTLLNFGEGKYRPQGSAGAIGDLVGEQNRGLAAMFHMMNEARIGVGLGATVLGYTGYLHALEYARSRPQGRLPEMKDPSAAQVPIIAHSDVKRMLLAQKAYVEGALGLCLYCARLVDVERVATMPEERRDATLLLDILTPVAKSWPSQWCLEANSLAIQVHGGYGYTRDYNVEQFYRDNRLNPIHEGTHGIQALDLLGRKVVIESGRALLLLVERITQTIESARHAEEKSLQQWGKALEAMVARLTASTRTLHGTGDVRKTLANASTYLEAFGHVVVAWIWLQQALVASGALETPGSGTDFYRGKLAACRYFYRFELPKVAPMLDLLDDLDTTMLEVEDAWF
jgi:alkylation response protein AidB-like acyl-CoA dehydrogenase